jgi:hypothetical protein
MDYSFIAYIFLCIVIGLGTFTQLTKANRTWAAILSLILFILIFVFYGMRWFRGTSTVFSYTGTWPPVINACPDYLVSIKNAPMGEACVDMIGVNKSGGALKVFTQEDVANPPQDRSKYFQGVYKPGLDAKSMKYLCDLTQRLGLTWEGIYNGDSCVYTGTA